MRIPITVTATFALLAGLTAAATAGEDGKKTLTRWVDPVIVQGGTLEAMQGKPIDTLRLLALVDAGFQPVPFQVDEYTAEGRKVLSGGPEANPGDGDGRLGALDELVFMAMDTGDRRTAASPDPAEADVLLEIEVLDPADGGRGWCYLASFPAEAPAPSSVSYTGTILPMHPTGYENRQKYFWLKGKQVEYRGETYNQIFYKDIGVPPGVGGGGVDFVDRIKWRVDIRLMFSLVHLRFDEDSLIGNFLSWQDGPVRKTYRVWARARLPLGLKSPRFVADVICYPSIVSTVTALSVPFNPGYVISRLVTRIGTDMNPNAYGMLFCNSKNPEGFVVDGRQSPQEKHMDPAMDAWRVLTGPQGTLMNRSFWSESFLEQAREVRIDFVDRLDEEDPPEFDAGQIGNTSSVAEVSSLEAGKYLIGIEWYFPPFAYTRGPAGPLDLDVVDAYQAYQDRPLELRVGSRVAASRVRPAPPKK